jgi:transcriptional regulator with XRE-family HTH domain
LSEQSFDLKAELKAIGMTQKDFANFIDFHTNSVSRWVRGEMEIPKEETPQPPMPDMGGMPGMM